MKKEINLFALKAKLSAIKVTLIIIFVSSLGISFVQKSLAAEISSKSNSLNKSAMSSYFQRHYGALTFDERIACQKAIEKTYYSHRTWNNSSLKPQFEEIITNDIISPKVSDIIRKSNALEFYWQRPITAEQLQAEIDRMSKHTKSPEVLKELFDALNNDPHLIAECIARPNLADRFIRNYYAYDDRFHHEIKKQAEMDLQKNSSVSQMRQMNGEYSEIEWKKSTGENRINENNGFVLNEAEWKARMQEMNINQLEIGKIGKLIEEDNKFYVQAILEKSADRIRIAQVVWHKKEFDFWWNDAKNNISLTLMEPYGYFNIPSIIPAESSADTWQPTFSCHKKRMQHTAIWTNSYNEMIIWGGYANGQLSNDGERYNPATDTWTCMSVINAPSARIGHTAIWAERRKDIIVMIIWGGQNASGAYERTGAWYDPVKDSWKTMKTWGAPVERRYHTAIWTGAQMIIWGGEVDCDNPPWCDSHVTNSGASYDPALEDSWFVAPWNPIARSNYAAPRAGHTAVFDQADMIVWGGHGCMDPPLCEWQFDYLVSGGKYNFYRSMWSEVSTINAPEMRQGHTAVWALTTNEMIVWGGFREVGCPGMDCHQNCMHTGGKYNPSTNQWTATYEMGPGRYNHTAIWTGDKMIIWGGYGEYLFAKCDTVLNNGLIYDPVWDTWAGVNSTNASSMTLRVINRMRLKCSLGKGYERCVCIT